MDYNPDCPAWGSLTWPKVGEFNLANGAVLYPAWGAHRQDPDQQISHPSTAAPAVLTCRIDRPKRQK